ncbi:xylose isomerase|nr:xylose isomerase [Candidatus Pantoea persica]
MEDLGYVDAPYPFTPGVSVADVRQALQDTGLQAIGVTPEIYLRKFSRGAFTHPEAAVYGEALALMNERGARAGRQLH